MQMADLGLIPCTQIFMKPVRVINKCRAKNIPKHSQLWPQN